MWTTTGNQDFQTYMTEANNLGIQHMCLATEIDANKEIIPYMFKESNKPTIASFEHDTSDTDTFNVRLEERYQSTSKNDTIRRTTHVAQ
jgi:hypothetical protein